jgi:hypothetical protein
MQEAGRYAAIKNPGQACSAVASHSDKVSPFAPGGVYDRLYDRAIDYTPPGLDAFLAELSPSGGQIGFGFLSPSFKLFLSKL